MAQLGEQLGGFTGFAIAADPSCASELRSSRFEIRELEVTNVLRFPALGNCIFEIWRFWRLEVTNVSRILALGGSTCRILRGLEVPRVPDSNGYLTALRSRVGPLKKP